MGEEREDKLSLDDFGCRFQSSLSIAILAHRGARRRGEFFILGNQDF